LKGACYKRHYLNSRLVGPKLRCIGELDGEWVVRAGIGQAAIHMEDRDTYIGWGDIQRGRRLKFHWAIASYAYHLTPNQRRILKCPNDKKTGKYRSPGETAIRELMYPISPQDVEDVLAE
jgi:hypothetical protein